MTQKKIPLRKCVGCQEMKPKRELIRVVHSPDDQVFLDPTGKKAGRGAYLCKSLACFQIAKKKKALDRSLKITVSDEVYRQLESDLATVKADG
ncbi:RNase P modulator RnpM [Effusibacillus pohliae]|uniref:RNase P modulator RnpM n=1 Tax=Effusibacillus pohliae TaxID=232270 RepID=UPI00037A8DEC|nr:YlxR family protein [Effusibacillus pohliae]